MSLSDWCVEVLPPGSDYEEWLRMRRRGIGGSDCSGVMGMSAYASPYTVWEDKTGRAVELDVTEAILWGNLLEPVIREQTATRLGLTVTQCGTLRSLPRPWQQFNPDGLFDDGGLLECKNTSAWMSGDWDGQVPDHAELQTQHGMSVTGATHAWVAGLVGGNRLVIHHVDRDDSLIELINETEETFWCDHVLTDVPPPMDPSEATTKALQRRYGVHDEAVEIDPIVAAQLQADWFAGGDMEKAGKAAKKKAENAFRMLMAGANQATVDGELVARVKRGVFATRRFATEKAAIANLYQKKVEVLDVDAIKAELPTMYRKYQAQVFEAIRLKGDNDNG